MVINEKKLAAGLNAVAEFIHEDEWKTLNEYGKHTVRKKLKNWLLPFLIKLPDYATEELVGKSFYEDEFWDASESFIIERMRENNLFDSSSDEELRLRLVETDVAEACSHLIPLVRIMLVTIENFEEPEPRENVSLQELEKSWDNLDLDTELGKFLKEKQ